MYKTTYKSLYRVHTIEEAIDIDIPVENKTDLFLYLIDVYDILLNISTGETFFPSHTILRTLREKLSQCLMTHYHKMYMPIPGVLFGWTESMLLWIVLLTVIELQHQHSTLEINDRLLAWVKTHRLRMFPDKDLTTWNFDTVVSQLNVLSLRWERLDPCEELKDFLEIMWRFAARFCLRLHTKDVLNVEMYQDEVPNMVRVRLTPDGMMLFLSRFYWFNQMIYYRSKWIPTVYHTHTFPSLQDTNWESWIKGEQKHFIARRFRDQITSWMWDKMLLFGDKEIGSHDQLGDDISAFTCMYARFPAGLISLWQKILTYEEPDQILQCNAVKHFVILHMINAHFTSVYNVSFLKLFFLYDKIIYKHEVALERCSAPIILYWYNRFVVFFRGKLYMHQDGQTAAHAFIVWCVLLRNECNGICYDSMDFNTVCEELLDQANVVNNHRVIDGFFTLEDA